MKACFKIAVSESARPWAQPGEHCQGARIFHPRRPTEIAAPEDGRSPAKSDTAPKRIFNPNSEAAGSGAGFQPVSAGSLPTRIWAGNSAVAGQHHRGLEARSDRLEACPTTDEGNSTSEFGFKQALNGIGRARHSVRAAPLTIKRRARSDAPYLEVQGK